MISKPIDLIVANAMHDNASKLALARTLCKSLNAKMPGDLHETLARNLLCSISHEAHIGKIYDALKLLGAPCSADDIMEGLRAIEDAK